MRVSHWTPLAQSKVRRFPYIRKVPDYGGHFFAGTTTNVPDSEWNW